MKKKKKVAFVQILSFIHCAICTSITSWELEENKRVKFTQTSINYQTRETSIRVLYLLKERKRVEEGGGEFAMEKERGRSKAKELSV